MRSRDYIELERRWSAPNYHPLSVVVARAKGVWVEDVDGRRYMDCLAAYSAVNQGHCHPRIVAALVQQAGRATLTSRAFHNDQLGPFCRELATLLGYERVLPMNTGAEAVETAIKAARRYGYRKLGIAEDRAEILVFDGNFHGRTTTIVGFSGEPAYRADFGPFGAGFRRLPYGDADAVASAMHRDVCAVLVEPIQGEAGVVVPPQGHLRRLREITAQHGALLVCDEIQSGLGRTGRMLCSDHDGVRPDVVVLGKALSGGVVPVSAVVADAAVLDLFEPGSHGSTYGGNPLGAAVARAALAVLVEEQLCESAASLGEHALRRLRAMDSPHVKEVRGRGLWIGIELHESAGGARPFCEALRAEGLLCKETHDHVIRFAPPLVVTRQELDWALDRLERVLLAPLPTA